MELWVVVLLGALVWWVYRELVGKRVGLPPGPTPLPIVGNIHNLDPTDLQGSFESMKKKYGDTFTFWLGNEPQVVMTNYAVVKDYFTGTKTADAFAGRPRNFTFEAFYDSPNSGIVFSTGDKWRETRRFSMHVLRDFGVGKSIMEDSIREEGAEMNAYIKELLGGKTEGDCDPSEPISICVVNVISRIIFGHAYDRNNRKLNDLRALISSTTETFGSPASLLLSTNPWLRHIPLFGHFSYDQIRRASADVWGFLDGEFEELRKTFDANNEPQCYVEAFWKEMAERKESGREDAAFEQFQLSRTVFDFWAAGFETTVTTLRWAVVFMTNFPQVQAKIHAELDAFYENDSTRPVKMEDRLSLPITSGAVNETQRMGNIIPLNLPHATTRDVEVEGFMLKEGTMIVPNFGSMLCDPNVFPDPDVFRPERFVEDGKTKKVDEFMPFSLGKRACAGEPLAKMELFILFAMLMRRYKFSVAPGASPPSMKSMMGQIRKPQTIHVHVTDRFPDA